LRDDAGAAPGKLAFSPLVDANLKPGAPQQQAREQAAHGAADHDGAPAGLLLPTLVLPAPFFRCDG
jgi:hypothetical protein